MKFIFSVFLLSSLAHAEPQVCGGSITLSESEAGPIFSGTITEGNYNTQFSYVDDDGFLTLVGANLAVLNSNNQFTSPPQSYRISDADKNLIITALRRQASYNEIAIDQIRQAAEQNIEQPDDAPTIAQIEELSVKVRELISYVQSRPISVPAAEWNAKVGKYIQEQMRGPRVYEFTMPNFQGKSGDNHQLCGNTVRCPCSINNSPFTRGRLCGIDYENPRPDNSEYARCSSFNLPINNGGGASGNGQRNSSRTRQQ